MTGLTEYTIYPQSCFHLSRTINCWLPLKAQQIHALDSHPDFEVKNVYFYLNHPIMWVKVVGIVVAIDEWSACRTYTIDDSSGATIECVTNDPDKPHALSTTKPGGAQMGERKPTVAAAQTTPANGSKETGIGSDIDVGDCIQVTGCIFQAKWARKIKTSKLKHVHSTAEEVRFWNKLVEFQREVLSRPWVLTEKEVRRCRRQAAEEPKDTERKQQVKERRRQSRKAGLRTKHLSEAVAAMQTETSQRRLTGLERKGKRLRTGNGETVNDTAGQVAEGVLRKAMPAGSSERLPAIEYIENELEVNSKRSNTSQSGVMAMTSLDTMNDATESLPEGDIKIAARTWAAGSAPARKRSDLVRISRGVKGMRGLPDEVTALDTQTALRRRATGLAQKSGRPDEDGEHETPVVAPKGKPYMADARRSYIEAVTHMKPSGLEPKSKRPKVGQRSGGSSTDIGERAKDTITSLGSVKTRVTGLERRMRRPAGTRIEGA